MKSLLGRLTYANVMSSIAVFLVLGGATALAAGGLAKHSVGTRQLKNGAITTAKLKNGAVTGSKLNLASIGKVPSAASADTAATAKSAETAGSANTANTAGSAKTAESAKFAEAAGNANSVAGSTVRKFFFAADEGAAPRPILSFGGLTLTAGCGEAGEPTLIATTSTDALLHVEGGFAAAFEYFEDDSFEPGETVDLLLPGFDSTQASFTYVRPDGTVVTATFESEQEAFEPEVQCLISGNAIG